MRKEGYVPPPFPDFPPAPPKLSIEIQSQSDWGFAANQFALATSPFRLKTSIFFQLNTCGYSPYVTSSQTKG
jgi:hypothetical protein